MALVVRELPRDEFWKVSAIPDGPLYGQDLSQATATHIMVAELDGAIQWYWPIAAVLHLDGLYGVPEARHRKDMILQLLGGVIQFLRDTDVALAFAVLDEGTLGTHLPMAEKLGLEKVPGDLYFLRV